jgi:hypothetical protein
LYEKSLKYLTVLLKGSKKETYDFWEDFCRKISEKTILVHFSMKKCLHIYFLFMKNTGVMDLSICHDPA